MKQIKLTIAIVLTLGSLFLTDSVNSQILAGTGGYSGTPGFDRGYQTTMHCGNWPESWLRGSAFLDKSTGVLTIHVGLETDAIFAGPKGQIVVYITDANGTLLAKIATAEVGRGGKAPGRAERTDIQTSLHVGSYIANNAARITVATHLTGFTNRLFNVPLQNVYDVAGNLIQAAAFFL